MHSPQSCSVWQPLHVPQRVIRFFLPWWWWWEPWRRTGCGAALMATSTFTGFWCPLSLSEAEEVSGEQQGQKSKAGPVNALPAEKWKPVAGVMQWPLATESPIQSLPLLSAQKVNLNKFL